MKIYFDDYKEQIKEAVKKEILNSDYCIQSPYYKYDNKQIEKICNVIKKRKYYIDSNTGKEYITNPKIKCIAYFEKDIKTDIEEALYAFKHTLLNEIQRINRGYNLEDTLNY